MYTLSLLTGKLYLNGVEIPLDDSKPEFQQYLIDKDIVGFELIDGTSRLQYVNNSDNVVITDVNA